MEAIQAKEKMHGRLACGRPLNVCLSSEKAVVKTSENLSKAGRVVGRTSRPASGSTLRPMTRTAKIAGIKNNLKSLEEDGGNSAKKRKQLENTS